MASLRLAIDAIKAKLGARMFVSGTKEVTAGAKKASSGVDRLNKRLTTTGTVASKTKKMIMGLVGGLGAMMVLRSVTKTVVDFEDSMLAVKAISKATGEEYKFLEDRARSLGATTRYTASEVADSMKQLAMTGFDVNEVYAAVPHTLNLAAAGMMGLERAGEVSSDMMKQFGLETDQMQRVTDVLVNAATSANTTVERMAEAMSYAGTTASGLGMTIEDTAAAVQVMGDAGIAASRAGTGLRAIMMALADVTPKAAKAFVRLGTSGEEIKKIMGEKGVLGVFKKLSESHVEGVEKLELYSKIFRRTGSNAALVLTKGVKDLERFRKANYDVAGAAQRNADIMNSGLGGALRTLKSAWQEAILLTGDSGFTGTLKGLVLTSTEVIRILFGMSSAGAEFSSEAKTMALVIKGLVGYFAVMAVMKIPGLFWAMSKALTAAAVSAVKLLAAITPIVAIIGTALLAFEIGRYFASEFKVVREVLTTLYTNFQKFVLGLKKIWLEVTTFMGWAWDKVFAGLAEVWSAFLTNVIEPIFYALEERALLPHGVYTGVMNAMSAAQRSAAESTESLSDRLAKVNEKLIEERFLLDQIEEGMFKDIDAEFEGKTRRSFLDFVTDDVLAGMDLLSEAADKLANRLLGVEEAAGGADAAIAGIAAGAGAWAKSAVGRLPGREIVNEGPPGGADPLAHGFSYSPELATEALNGVQELTEAQKLLGEASENAASMISSGFANAIVEGKSLGEVFQSLAMDIAKMVIQMLLMQALKAGMSAIGLTPAVAASGGGLVVPSQARPFAAGGMVVDQPTYFPIGGGKTGVAGERGAEALSIIPLNRLGGKHQSTEETPAPQITLVNAFDMSESMKAVLAKDPNVVLNVVHSNLAQGRSLSQLLRRRAQWRR